MLYAGYSSCIIDIKVLDLTRTQRRDIIFLLCVYIRARLRLRDFYLNWLHTILAKSPWDITTLSAVFTGHLKQTRFNAKYNFKLPLLPSPIQC